MKDVAHYIQSNAHIGNGSLTMANLAKMFAVSQTKLKQGFKANYGVTIHAFIIHTRMESAKRLLKQNKLAIKEVAVMLGYDELSNFSRDFKRHEGIRPREYKMKNQEDIHRDTHVAGNYANATSTCCFHSGLLVKKIFI